MLNTQHFTYLAGTPEPWNTEMRSRIDQGESLVDLQVEFHGRGRCEAHVVKTLKGYSVRYASGLDNFGLLFRGCDSYEDAVQKGTEWVQEAPTFRALYVRNSDIP